MSAVCFRCSRPGPPEANFCWFDGVPLPGKLAAQPVAESFPEPLAFPTGETCRTFDELALACCRSWDEALGLLAKGRLRALFQSLKRDDLTAAAESAARNSDLSIGLDELLGRLPTRLLRAPRLEVQPTEFRIGPLRIGQDHRVELRMTNSGHRLIAGSVSSLVPWISPSHNPHVNTRWIQFNEALTISLFVRGDRLRAGNQPLEGTIVIDTNAGLARISVRVEVTSAAYAEAPFAGSTTPRAWADIAKKRRGEASAALDSGAVRRWYRDNGWTYPIVGPSARGLAGLQQFFEALGLAKPPRVTVSETRLRLRGPAGSRLTHEILLRTDEKRIVHGWGRSSATWLMPGSVVHRGNQAVLPIDVVVPDGAGSQSALLTVRANGDQRFEIEVCVEVEANDPQSAVAPATTNVAPLPDFLREALAQEGDPVPQPANLLVKTIPMAILIAMPIDPSRTDPAPPRTRLEP
jgi:hypothetical protein